MGKIPRWRLGGAFGTGHPAGMHGAATSPTSLSRRSSSCTVGLVMEDLWDYSLEAMDLDAIHRAAATSSEILGQDLAQRLGQSVLPLFIGNDLGRPERLASCVLVRVDRNLYAFTAGHVLEDAGTSVLWASPGPMQKLRPLPCSVGYQTPAASAVGDLDIGILPLRASVLGDFARCTFLDGLDLDEEDRPDDRGLAASYFVLGYSASRSQARVSHTAHHIDQTSFQLMTYPPGPGVYSQEGLPQADHLLLDFDHYDVLVGGKAANPPKLQGVSGGGVFYVKKGRPRTPLVAIATRHRRAARLLVGTRLKHFLRAARQLNAIADALIFE